MEEKPIAVGARLYRYFDDPDYGHRRIKGEVVSIKKNIFGVTKVKVMWDDGRHGKYSVADIRLWMENREDEQKTGF